MSNASAVRVLTDRQTDTDETNLIPSTADQGENEWILPSTLHSQNSNFLPIVENLSLSQCRQRCQQHWKREKIMGPKGIMERVRR